MMATRLGKRRSYYSYNSTEFIHIIKELLFMGVVLNPTNQNGQIRADKCA